MDDYVAKPLKPAELLKKIEQVVNGLKENG
jgi:DNA-binding response OmpR family regulator